MSHSKKLALVAISLVASTTVAFAQPDLDTGGYTRELQTKEMMEMLDADGNNMVTKQEFKNYYSKLFDLLDKNKDNQLDEKEWIGASKDIKPSLATGGYVRELKSVKLMGAMDSDKNIKVSREEFLAFNETIFNRMDIKSEGEIDPQNWLRKITRN